MVGLLVNVGIVVVLGISTKEVVFDAAVLKKSSIRID